MHIIDKDDGGTAVAMTHDEAEQIFESIGREYYDGGTYEGIYLAMGKPEKYESEMSDLLRGGDVKPAMFDAKFSKERLQELRYMLAEAGDTDGALPDVIELLGYLGAETCEIVGSDDTGGAS